MICIQVDIPQSVCDIDDELKRFITAKILYVFGFLKHEMTEISSSMIPQEC